MYLLTFSFFVAFAAAVTLPSGINPKIPFKDFTVCAVGDSITWGKGTTSTNSYRELLQQLLQQAGAKITYLGTKRSGDFTNNQNEGFPGYTIDEIATQFAKDVGKLASQPDVFTLIAGTNDCLNIHETPEWHAEAPLRLGSFIDQLLKPNPNAIVVVAQIPFTDLDNDFPQVNRNVTAFNNVLPELVATKQKEGQNIRLVNLELISGALIGPDQVHPTDLGYDRMAELFFTEFQNLHEDGWFS